MLQALSLAKEAESAKILADSGVTPQSLNTAINELRKGRTADSASAEQAYDALKRYTRDLTEAAREGNSLLVTFELTAHDGGTLLRMTESGFREMGWEVAVLEAEYNDHVSGWDHFLPRLVRYAASVQVAS